MCVFLQGGIVRFLRNDTLEDFIGVQIHQRGDYVFLPGQRHLLRLLAPDGKRNFHDGRHGTCLLIDYLLRSSHLWSIEVTWVIVITFLFPAVIAGMIWHWMWRVSKKVIEKETETKEQEKLIDVLEKVVKTKDSIIDKLKY